jgi:hypothetical protein
MGVESRSMGFYDERLLRAAVERWQRRLNGLQQKMFGGYLYRGVAKRLH